MQNGKTLLSRSGEKSRFIAFCTSAIFVILVGGLSLVSAQEKNIDDLKKEFQVEVQNTPCDSALRKEAVIALFKKMGAPASAITTQKFDKGENIVITKAGRSTEKIVVGAHYDKVDDGCGAVDNWSGIIILANIYRKIAASDTQKTYIFLAFDSEEKGLFGSKHAAKALKEDDAVPVCSMVNFDSFASAAPQAPSNMANTKLLDAAKKVAKEVEFTLYSDPIDNADSDSSAFNDLGIPAISFDGLSSVDLRYLHNTNDRIASVKVESLLTGYAFGLRFVASLDSLACDSFYKKKRQDRTK